MAKREEVTLVTYSAETRETYNTYVTLAEATKYLSSHLSYSDKWFDEAANPDITLEHALVAATRLLDLHYWPGSQTSVGQNLRWPRILVKDPDANRSGFQRETYLRAFSLYFDEDTIPKFIMDATCEIALDLLSNNRFAGRETSHASTINLGKLSVSTDVNNPQLYTEVTRSIIARVIGKNGPGMGAA